MESEDDSLYNAMIWALSIGIIVVIATLFLTRPEPENFTELYFNNHTSLPEYINLEERYDYQFTIHNLENKKTQYNFTINTELYKFDLSCERPDLWLEGEETRKTETNDPALYIKEETYGITFNYNLVNSNYIKFKLVDTKGIPKYSINIDHKNNLLQFTTDKIYQWNISTNKTTHKLTIYIDKEFTRVILDTEEFYFLTNYDYTGGFPYLETEYSEISGFQILRRDLKENVNIRIAESKYAEIPLIRESDKGIVILYSKYLASPLYDKVINEPVVRIEKLNDTLSYYYTKDAVNLTDYTLKTTIRTYTNSKVETGFIDQLNVSYINSALTVNEVQFNVTPLAWSEISIRVANTTTIYFNNQKITEYNQSITAKPFIKAYNNALVKDFTIKSNDIPATIKYLLPEKQVITYSGLYTISAINYIQNRTTQNNTIQNNSEDDNDEAVSRLQDLYEREKINWTNYKITASYLDKTRKNEFMLSYGSINNVQYSIKLDNETATITFNNKTETMPVVSYSINVVRVDVNNGTVIIYLNDKELRREKMALESGFVLFEYPGITLINAQAENRDTNTLKVYKKQTNVECLPILINTYEYTDSRTLDNEQSLIFDAFINIQEPFDIAKVQVTLNNNQEIHYWVKQK